MMKIFKMKDYDQMSQKAAMAYPVSGSSSSPGRYAAPI